MMHLFTQIPPPSTHVSLRVSPHPIIIYPPENTFSKTSSLYHLKTLWWRTIPFFPLPIVLLHCLVIANPHTVVSHGAVTPLRVHTSYPHCTLPILYSLEVREQVTPKPHRFHPSYLNITLKPAIHWTDPHPDRLGHPSPFTCTYGGWHRPPGLTAWPT